MNITYKAFLASALACAAMASSAKTGDSWKSAGSISAGKTKTVTLVPEKDLDDGSVTEDGVYYLETKCSRYTAYTIYTMGVTDDSGIDMSVDDITTYKDYGDKDPPYLPAFGGSTDSDGNIRYILYQEDWDEDCASSGKYYVRITGSIGQSVTVAMAKGEIEEPIQFGTEENPASLTVGTGTRTGKLIGGYYWFKANLTAGKKYTFWTEGGTEDAALTLTISGDSEEGVDDPDTREMTSLDENNQGFIVVPSVTGLHFIVVEGDETSGFTLNYGEIASRLPEKHNATDMGTLTSSGYSDAECEPGHRNDPDSGFFDNVIDQKLYKAKLAKGKVYAFGTDGATAPLVIEVYRKDGAVVASGRGGTTRSEFDCAVSYACEVAGDYWVGVCEDLADDENDEPSGMTVTFSAALVEPGKDGLVDAWDAGDDTYLGAQGLAPGMGEFTSHGPHTLGAADFVDFFRVDARNGIVYALKAELDESADVYDVRMAKFPLQADIYTLNGTTLRKFDTVADLLEGGSFTAAANASYYVAVSVKGGQGQDYGPYAMMSMATGASGLGELTVNIAGASFADGATWQIASPVVRGVSEPKYPGGSSIFLAAGDYKLTFAKVKDWTQPDDVVVKVVAGKTTPVYAKYSDTYDVASNDAVLGDGSASGKKVTTLKPSSKGDSVSRSLWSDDESDWYKVAVVANTRYRFALAVDQELGDAEISVFRENATDVVACGTEVEFLCREKKATYYVRVGHASAAKEDSRYVMSYSSAAVGGIAFKGNLSVKDTATSATLTVKRTGGKEGRVRVRYSTFAGTALPGRSYVPQSGYLEWADGDAKDRTIVLDLIPDLVAAWDEDRAFTVELATVPSAELEEDESVPGLGSPSVATVMITEATKKSTGTIALVGYGSDCEGFASPKKPAVQMPAGEDMEFWLERTGGSDGDVAVTVTPTKGTAAAGVHFDAEPVTLVWAHGEAGAKPFTLRTFATDEEYMSAKTLTLKVAANKAAASSSAKIGVSSAAVTLRDPKVTKTVETYAASFAKADGIAVKAAKTDTWYFNEVGDMVGVTPAAGGKIEMTVTLTGAGRFTCAPTFVAPADTKSTCTVTIGRETIALSPGEETEIRRYFAKGSTKVQVTLVRAKDAKGYEADDSEVTVTFADQGDGSPFGWKTLPTPELVSPLAGEVTLTGSCLTDEHEQVKFSWSGEEDPEIVYVFTLDGDKKNLGTAKAMFPGEALSECEKLIRVYCADCVVKPFEGQLASEKTYYWRVDTTFADDDCTITNVSKAVWQMTPMECTGAPYAVVTGGTDAYGNEISSIEKVGSVVPVALIQGISVSIDLGGEQKDEEGGVTTLDGATFSLMKGSSLPMGLKLKDGRITGAPSKAGKYTAVIQASHKAKGARTATKGGTITLEFNVDSLDLAEGTFYGVVATEDERIAYDEDDLLPADAAARMGSVTVAASGAGKISAKFNLGGTSYSYSANGWNGTKMLDNGQLAVWAEITNVTKLTTAKTSSSPATTTFATNVLSIVACCGDTDDREALDTPMTVSLVQSFLASDKKSVYDGLLYEGQARRDNKKLAGYAEDLAPFVGYYTISLVPQDPVDYISGYGYLTLTINAKGVVKMTGVLADGVTKPSASFASYVSESSVNGRPELRIPVSYAKGKVAFCGIVVICLDESDVPYVTSGSRVRWINADPASTYEGECGFSMEIEPVGGFYGTIYNLQAYYLGYDFAVRPIDVDSDLPEEVLGSHEAYVCYPGMTEMYLSVSGNAITAPKQSLSYRETVVNNRKTKLIDWENSVNPENLTVSFKQATGIYTGKFDIYAGDGSDDDGLETKQTKLGSFPHQGVLVMNRDVSTGSLSFDDAIMPGFYTVPVTRKFKATLPFVIAPEERTNDWDDETWSESLP